MQPDAPHIPPPASAVQALTCPSCGGGVALRAAGFTVHVACEYCGSILDVTNPLVKLVTKSHEQAAILEIPIGTRGTLRGVEWEAIGYLRRSEGGQYGWEEYLLFNPYHGYRWLVKARGGWSFGETLTVIPEWRSHGQFAIADESFTHFFADAKAQVDYVLGEFYWRVRVGEKVEASDWVRPGAMLSREKNDKEVSWTRSALLSAAEMRNAFAVEAQSSFWPPLPHQPSPWGGWIKTGAVLGAIAFVFLLVVAIAFSGTSLLAQASFPVSAGGRDQSVTLTSITLPRPYQRVEIRAEVPRLDNGWVDLDYRLVDRRTQQAYEAYGAAERYSGRDSDGDWNEGSRRSTVSVASVPAGAYDLVVEYKGNRWSGSSAYLQPVSDWMASSNRPEVRVEVRRGAIFGGNLLLALLLIAAPLLFAIVRHLAFEKARKDQSDFAAQSGEDE